MISAISISQKSLEIQYLVIDLATLNDSSPQLAHSLLLRCCGATPWARRMVEQRPFSDVPQLLQTADRYWCICSAENWRKAFAAQQRIGEHFQDSWANQEQSGITVAGPGVSSVKNRFSWKPVSGPILRL